MVEGDRERDDGPGRGGGRERGGDPEVRRALGLGPADRDDGRRLLMQALGGGDGGRGARPPRDPGGRPWGWIALAAAVGLALLLFLTATVRVDAGEACAVTRFSAVSREVGPGLHFRIPGVEDFHCYSTRTTFYEVLEQGAGAGNSGADFLDTPVDGVTNDGQPLTITFNLRYRIPAENVGEIYANIGRTMQQVNENVVKFHARSITRQQVQTFSATDLYSGALDTVSRDIEALVAPRLAESFVELEYYELKRPQFQEAFTEAIEQQQIAREQIETRQNEAVAAEQEAIRVANLARGEAEAQQIRAAGEATAIALRGQAVRDNPEIISLNYIEALRTINWAILDGESVTPFLTIQPPGEGGAPAVGPPAPAEPTPPSAETPAAGGTAPTPAPVPSPPPDA